MFVFRLGKGGFRRLGLEREDGSLLVVFVFAMSVDDRVFRALADASIT